MSAEDRYAAEILLAVDMATWTPTEEVFGTAHPNQNQIAARETLRDDGVIETQQGLGIRLTPGGLRALQQREMESADRDEAFVEKVVSLLNRLSAAEDPSRRPPECSPLLLALSEVPLDVDSPHWTAEEKFMSLVGQVRARIDGAVLGRGVGRWKDWIAAKVDPQTDLPDCHNEEKAREFAEGIAVPGSRGTVHGNSIRHLVKSGIEFDEHKGPDESTHLEEAERCIERLETGREGF